ncbi:uncharacterized protein NECHADRAFT_35564 [Fusarium vanettenii 77-13-4]|uniref:DNA (cytosine-5-)-methyltransferase n=1 Tax=Fusarium vanettenii (strain ATCC MYA-4622 / CBS 123669 / FGSC 9596 / NRRL 45880 / 77-13-4) TaxID=660122 RepID=C7YMQ5_FUSV7|nr:uncharacterized protein NECHADRAFT_35564 [Fusarium vanettenii 77-13-4]EEU46991.1 hypothetical protein NECHADRAFT_35564 [Fusarium vanettenii 77-13-4]
MPASYINLEQEDEVCFLTERPSGCGDRQRRDSSCTITDESPPIFGTTTEGGIDLTVDLRTSGHHLLNDDEFALEKVRVANYTIQPGTFLQVHEFDSGDYLVQFVLVKIVVRCTDSGEIKIRGIPFTRLRSAWGKLPRKAHEVCMLLSYNQDDPSASEEFVDIGPSSKLEVYFIGQGSRKRQTGEAFVRVHESEVLEPKYRISEEVLSNQWRGTRVKGGSWAPTFNSQQDCINLDDDNGIKQKKIRAKGQKYTLFDSCSGAGGVSRGALMAGFKIQYAIDKAPEVWDTYETNFPDTHLFKMSLDEFLSFDNQHMRVDVLHFSPPCQFFSPAHTHASAQDDDNIFALYSCNQLLKKLRPRIITVEQTFGLTHHRHAEYFYSFLADFTQHGYSVRWRVIKLCTWGAAQDRKRLILIAAAPGERLPPFPQPTHGPEAGLLPYNSIGKAIRGIRPGDDLHDLDNVKYYQPRRAPYDANRLAGTITTRGGDFYYPDGTRNLTLREYASLQGFPKNHQFLGTMTSIKRQIGNAFPPNTVRVLYKHIEQWLLKEDGMLPYDDSRDAVIIDDDDTDSTTNLTDVSEDEFHRSPEMMEGSVMPVGSNEGARTDWRAGSVVIDLT